MITVEEVQMTRKPGARTKGEQIVFRTLPDLKAQFAIAVRDTAPAVAADGGVLGYGHLLEYFMADFAGRAPAERNTLARELRRRYQDWVDKEEVEAAASPQPAASPAENLANHTVGGHTRGERVSVDDVFGKPIQRGAGRRPDRKKMWPEVDR